jgi:hypothetical protein
MLSVIISSIAISLCMYQSTIFGTSVRTQVQCLLDNLEPPFDAECLRS